MKVAFLYSNNLQQGQRQNTDDKNDESSSSLWGCSINYI